jgi:hypothetical protein
MLFHVEHKNAFEYRWRIQDSQHEPWTEGVSDGSRAKIIFPGVAGCRIDAEWRDVQLDDSLPKPPWRKAALHEFATGAADFSIEPIHQRETLPAGKEVVIVAPSEFIDGAASYCFTPSVDMHLAPGIPAKFRAVATSPHAFNHLPIAACFNTGSGAFRVVNLTRSEGSLSSVNGDARLTQAPPLYKTYAAIIRKTKK